MGQGEPATSASGEALLALYDRALPEVYGYVLSRCGDVTIAEEVTADAFLAAVGAVKRESVPELTVAWLIGVARHKLVDHWRREARRQRHLALAAEQLGEIDDRWDDVVDATVAQTVLAGLGAHHRAALTLRYVDGLPVPEVAEHLGRTVHATEALLTRARSAFRHAYGDRRSDG